jgi:hypothetical protein
MNNIYEMKLHEEFYIDSCIRVLRVPGGWIYITKRETSFDHKSVALSSVFVPYNNEFQEGVQK